MDIATITGIVSGIALIVISISLGGSGFGIFINIPSVMIVLGGTIAATLINFPLKEVLGVFSTVKNAFMHSQQSPVEVIKMLVRYATIARKEGILALDSYTEEIEDDFLKRGIQLAVDGTAPELIKDILTTELAFLEDRHSLGQGIFNSMGAFAPAFGMIGTLIGLIQMLVSLSDPSGIGAGMAVALITTLYGAFLANIFFLPIAGKLRVRTQTEILVKEVIIEGILSIQSGDNPRVVEQKLEAFISPKLRQQYGMEVEREK